MRWAHGVKVLTQPASQSRFEPQIPPDYYMNRPARPPRLRECPALVAYDTNVGE